MDCRQTHRQTKALPGQPGDRTRIDNRPGRIGGNRGRFFQSHASHRLARPARQQRLAARLALSALTYSIT